MTKTKGGFDVVNYWIKMHRIAMGFSWQDAPAPSSQSKIQFNSRIRVLKDRFGWDSGDILLLIDYLYFHNPFGFEHKSDNGNIRNLIAAATKFNKWRKDHMHSIDRLGERKFLMKTRNAYGQDQQFLQSVMSMQEDLNLERLI